MKYFQPLYLLTVSTVASAAALVRRRDFQTVTNDITAITQQVATVQSGVDAFRGGPFSAPQALKIQTDSIKLNKLINQGEKDAKASPNFNGEQSFAIAGQVLDLQPNINKVLDSLVAKKDGFKTALFGLPATPLVKVTLETLRKSTAAFGREVTAKLTPDIQEIAPVVLKEIDDKFVAAIQAFS